MPSKSKEQHDFMNIVAHNEEFAEKVHVPQDIAKEFLEADEAKGLYQKPEPQEKK